MKLAVCAIVLSLLLIASPARADISLDDCKLEMEDLATGMTRGDMEKKGFSYDGGLNGMFKDVRVIASNIPQPNLEHPKLCMATVDFRPAGVPDAVLNDPAQFDDWMKKYTTQADVTDIVMSVSEPFLDWYHQD